MKKARTTLKMPDMALVFEDFTTKFNNPVLRGQRLHGEWIPGRKFKFPMTQPDGETKTCVATNDLVGPIIE